MNRIAFKVGMVGLLFFLSQVCMPALIFGPPSVLILALSAAAMVGGFSICLLYGMGRRFSAELDGMSTARKVFVLGFWSLFIGGFIAMVVAPGLSH